MTSPYQSPTKRMPADVFIDDGNRLGGDLYLHPNTTAPGGYESVLTMMNNDEAFFPVADKDGTIVLVGKRRTVSLSYSLPEDVSEEDVTKSRVRLEVVLSDGRTLPGWAVLELPRTHPRTLDFLNGPGTFLPIHDDARLHLVNRDHIRTVHPLD